MRDFTLMCVGCGWTVRMPVVDGVMDITSGDGWTVGEGEAPLCERCSRGWRPRVEPPYFDTPPQILCAEQSDEPGGGS